MKLRCYVQSFLVPLDGIMADSERINLNLNTTIDTYYLYISHMDKNYVLTKSMSLYHFPEPELICSGRVVIFN